MLGGTGRSCEPDIALILGELRAGPGDPLMSDFLSLGLERYAWSLRLEKRFGK